MPESDHRPALRPGPNGKRRPAEEEDPREQLRLRLAAAQEWLELVRLCQSVPAQQRAWWRSPLFSRCEHVYLLWCALRSAHKIGYSGRQHHERRGELEGERSRHGLSYYGRLD